MSTTQPMIRHQSMIDPFEVAGDAAATAERITLPTADSASAVPRPKDVPYTWLEAEYDELAEEQSAHWTSATAAETRKPGMNRAGLELRARELEHSIAGSRELVDQAQLRLLNAQEVLSPHRRRAIGSKHWYQVAKACIFVGDLAGVATGAIWLGEPIFIAITLAASAAAATVVAGLVGTEYSDMRRRKLRERAPEDLSPEQHAFAHLFSSADAGAGIVKLVLLLSLFTALMIGVGIGALRAAVDDPLVGVIFAGIAFAVAGGSFLVSYAGADEAADLLDLYQADYATQQQRHLKLSADPSWNAWAQHGVEEASVRDEFTSRGTAATKQMQALKWRILRSNPTVAGHGPRPEDPVGRTPRKGVK